jgi:hypothetical protein
MKIYNLTQEAENYRWLEYIGNWFDFFHNINIEHKKIDNFNLNIKCKTIRDKKERVLGDFPCFPVPVISQKAKNVLEKHIDDLIQIFPLDTGKLGNYYFINIFNVIDCLDKEKSELIYLSENSSTIYKIKKAIFNNSLNNENSRIFIIKELLGGNIFINEEIKNIIEDNQLEGFVIKEVGEI